MGGIHFLTTGNQACNKRYPTAIMEFIKSLNPKLMWALAKKHADPQTRPQTLQQAFNMAEEVSRRILETESFKRSSTVWFSGSVNNIYKHKSEINEVAQGKYTNNYKKSGYNKNYNKNRYYGKKDWNKNTKEFLPKERQQERIQGQGCLSYINKRCKISLFDRLGFMGPSLYCWGIKCG